MDKGQLFKDHTKFKNVSEARNQVNLNYCVLQHFFANGLKSLVGLTSLKMDIQDNTIWDDAYDEEYNGLVSLTNYLV